MVQLVQEGCRDFRVLLSARFCPRYGSFSFVIVHGLPWSSGTENGPFLSLLKPFYGLFKDFLRPFKGLYKAILKDFLRPFYGLFKALLGPL